MKTDWKKITSCAIATLLFSFCQTSFGDTKDDACLLFGQCPISIGSIHKERIVLMPLLIDEDDKELESEIDAALVEELNQKYEVLSGEQIKEKSRMKLLKMFKTNPSQDETKVMQDITKSLHSDFYAKAEISKNAYGYYLSLDIRNISKNSPHSGIVYDRGHPCNNCDADQVVQKIRVMVGEAISSEAQDREREQNQQVAKAQTEQCSKDKNCYCTYYGILYETVAQARDQGESPQQWFKALGGYWGRIFTEKLVKKIVNQVYFDSGFINASGEKLNYQMRDTCLGNTFKPLK